MVLSSLVGSTAGTEQALVLLLIIAAAVAVVARRIGLPYIIGLVLVGLVVGLGLHLESLRLSSDLVFYVFLPILLFESGYNLEATLLRDQWRRIAVLAVPGVLVAFLLTALGVHLLGGLAWSIALLFGALIAATDPVSVVALFRKLGVSERLTTLVDAESLFNDGAAAVLFAVVIAVVVDGRAFSPGWAVGSFLWMSLGGTAVGFAVGYGASWIHRRLDDHLIEITLSTIVAYGSFLLAQALGMSGVVACVTAAIILGNLGRRHTMSPMTRVTLTTVWDYAAFVANSLIFLLIGLSVHLELILEHLGTVVIAFLVVVAARAVTVYGFGALARVFRAGPPLSWQHVLVWGGLRGTIALALVLSVPAAAAGRSELVTVTFGVVLLSLVGQGLTIPWLTRKLGLAGEARSAGERDREVLLDGFVRAHEELVRLEDAGVVGRVERRDLERVIDAGEMSVLEGLPPLVDEPVRGEESRLVERIGELVGQRRRVEALLHGGAVTGEAATSLNAGIDGRIVLLASRLGEEPGASAGSPGLAAEPPGAETESPSAILQPHAAEEDT